MTSVNDDNLAGRAFEIPGQDVSVHQARYLFFRAVHRVNPGVTDELMGEPLGLFRSLAPLLEPSRAAAAVAPPPWRGYPTPARDVLMPFWDVFKHATEHDPEEFNQLRDRLLH